MYELHGLLAQAGLSNIHPEEVLSTLQDISVLVRPTKKFTLAGSRFHWAATFFPRWCNIIVSSPSGTLTYHVSDGYTDCPPQLMTKLFLKRRPRWKYTHGKAQWIRLQMSPQFLALALQRRLGHCLRARSGRVFEYRTDDEGTLFFRSHSRVTPLMGTLVLRWLAFVSPMKQGKDIFGPWEDEDLDVEPDDWF